MADTLKSYARHVQRAIEADDSLEVASYQTCLRWVKQHLLHCIDLDRDAAKARLVELIKPLCKKAPE